jgi:hypothetical protein
MDRTPHEGSMPAENDAAATCSDPRPPVRDMVLISHNDISSVRNSLTSVVTQCEKRLRNATTILVLDIPDEAAAAEQNEAEKPNGEQLRRDKRPIGLLSLPHELQLIIINNRMSCLSSTIICSP